MAMTIISGGNFSGRSEALRTFAWGETQGQYLHPDIELNMSGLASTVAGERFLHGLEADPDDHRRLRSLSGGERSDLALECALSGNPSRLAVDCALEQLDRRRREAALSRLAAFAAKSELWLADNVLNGDIDSTVARKSYLTTLPDFNRSLFVAAEAVRKIRGEAPSIRLDDLSFNYRGRTTAIFERTTYELEPGVVYVLNAPNGSGKSTLARLLIGVIRAPSGAIVVAGTRFKPHGSSPLFYAFQNPRDQIFGRSARDYLNRVAQLAALRDRYRFSPWNTADPMATFGLTPFDNMELWDLPPVALKRLGLAAAFFSGAPWLFFDEPALGLDEVGREALAMLLDAAAEAGRGIIAVTHGSEFDTVTSARPITIRDCRLCDGRPKWG